MRSAIINPAKAPNQPPILRKEGKRKNKPNNMALAGQKIARKNNGRPKIPTSAQTKMIPMTIANARKLSGIDCAG